MKNTEIISFISKLYVNMAHTSVPINPGDTLDPTGNYWDYVWPNNWFKDIYPPTQQIFLRWLSMIIKPLEIYTNRNLDQSMRESSIIFDLVNL